MDFTDAPVTALISAGKNVSLESTANTIITLSPGEYLGCRFYTARVDPHFIGWNAAGDMPTAVADRETAVG
jgi:hypothetical protein